MKHLLTTLKVLAAIVCVCLGLGLWTLFLQDQFTKDKEKAVSSLEYRLQASEDEKKAILAELNDSNLKLIKCQGPGLLLEK